MKRLLIFGVIAAALLTSGSAANGGSFSSPLASQARHVAAPQATSRPTAAMLAELRSRNPVTTATAIAEGYWGATPCQGQIKVTANQPLFPGLASGTDGWVTFNSSLGPDRLDAPASTYTACTITLAHWRWPTATAMEQDWGMFCLTVTHEVGHLLGHKHTLTPGSVMNPVFTNDSDVPAVCNSTWLPGWRYGTT